jgi:3-isopropylmalate/(R)-2-methylmalate dehydratase small subunit
MQEEYIMNGRVHRVGDDINTDLIIASKNKRDSYDPKVMAVHLFEDLDPEFYSRIKQGDIIVAGKNFGCGSSREHAAHVIKAAGISAVLAKSFARIFFRNAINIGLPLLECDTDAIEEGDELSINLIEGVIKNITKESELRFNELPPAIASIFDEGGLVEYLKKYGTFK